MYLSRYFIYTLFENCYFLSDLDSLQCKTTTLIPNNSKLIKQRISTLTNGITVKTAQKDIKTSEPSIDVEAFSTWSMRSSSLARTWSSLGGIGSGAVSAGEDGLETEAAAAEQAATAAESRPFSV